MTGGAGLLYSIMANSSNAVTVSEGRIAALVVVWVNCVMIGTKRHPFIYHGLVIALPHN